MAIPIPVSKTVISSPQWGIPITNEVNRLTTRDTANTRSAWTNLTLGNGWTAMPGTGIANRYSKIGDSVTLQFACQNGSNGNPFATLPAGFRPIYEMTLLARAGGSPPQAIVLIRPDGTITPYYPAGATTDLLVGIITFPLT